MNKDGFDDPQYGSLSEGIATKLNYGRKGCNMII